VTFTHLQKRFARLLIINGYLPKIFLAAIIGFATGLVAIAFHKSLEWATAFVFSPWVGENALPWWSFAPIPAVGGLLVGLILFKITKTPEASGQGTDNMIRAFHYKGGKIRRRVAPVKFLTSVITLSSGGSAGYEGPVSQIGSSVASGICRLFRMPRSLHGIFTLAGTAAGLGAIFKAPLAGALTSVEVLYREDFESNAFVTSIVASVTAFTVYIAFVGSAPVFAVGSVFPFTNFYELLACALLGVLCAPFSFLYVKIYEKTEKRFAKSKVSNAFKPAIGGLFVGLILLVYPEVAGGGFDFVGKLFSEMLPTTIFGILLLLSIALAKIFATAFTVGSGGSGGVFGPSLFIGGVLGAAFAGAIEMAFPGLLRVPEAMILVGMGSFFAGAAKAPIAGVVMVCEMTGSYSLLPGLLMSAVMHIAFSRPWSIYKSQVLNKFVSPAHRGDLDQDVLRIVQVKEVITNRKFHVLRAEDPLLGVLPFIDSSSIYPVYENENYLGLLDMSILRNTYMAAPGMVRHLQVSDCTVKAPLLLDSLDLHAASKIFVRLGVSELCVKNSKGEIVGTLSHSEIFKIYDKIVSGKRENSK
jgi:CIC family chloride channel protein